MMGVRDKWAKKLLMAGCLLLTACLTGLIGGTTQAATYSCSWGMPSRTFSMRYANTISDTWKGYVTTSRSRWNSSGAGSVISISSVAGQPLTIKRYPSSTTWWGLTTAVMANGKLVGVTVEINTERIANYAPAGKVGVYGMSTMVHEFGHTMKLKHNTVNSVMNVNRDREVTNSPTSYDVANVKACY